MLENTQNYGAPIPNKKDEDIDVADSLAQGIVIFDTEIKNRANDLQAHKDDAAAHDSKKITHEEGTVSDAFTEVNSRITEVDTRVTDTANQAVETANTTASQLDRITGASSIDPQVSQALVGADGKTYVNIGNRFDTVDASLADIALQLKPSGTDDTEAIRNAIKTDKNNLLWHEGTYFINSPISEMLKGNRKWTMRGEVIFKYTGSSNDIMINIDLSGYNFVIEGHLTINGDNKAREGLKIQNLTTSMDNAVNISMTDVKAINLFSSTVGYGAKGITVQGGFNLVNLVRCGAVNISRDAGVGNPGVQGSNGIIVTHNDINAYPRQVIINDPKIDTITSLELDGSANNLDCDGLAVFAPLDGASNVMSDSVLMVNGGIFANCRGRSIKSQMALTLVDDTPTFIRNSVKSIPNGFEVDFQYGVGSLKNFVCKYDPLPDNSSPFGSSFSLVTATLRNQPNGVGYITVDKGEIINNVPPSTSLPYLLTFTALTQSFNEIKITNIKHLGTGRFKRGVYGDTSKIKQLIIDTCYFSWIETCLVENTGGVSNAVINRIYHAGSSVPLYNGSLTLLSALNNTGFTNTNTLKDITSETFKNTKGATFYHSNGNSSEGLTVWDYLGTTKIFGLNGLGVMSGKTTAPASYASEFFIPYAIKTTAGAPTANPLKSDGTSAIGVTVLNTNENRLYIHIGAGVWKYIQLT